MQLSVSHITQYNYSEPIQQITQCMRMTPSEHAGLRVLQWTIESEGATFGSSFTDGAGDLVQTVSNRCTSSSFEIKVSGLVETTDTNGVLKAHRERINPRAYLQTTAATLPDKKIQKLARKAASTTSHTDDLEKAHQISNLVTDAIEYEHASTSVTTTAAEALKSGRGVCQDYAHILISAASVIDLPARYISGYLLDSDNLSPREASHAWAEVFISGLGWVGFDPSGRCCPDARYIRLASGLDAIQGAPIRGMTRGSGTEELDVTVAVKSMQQ